MANLESQSSLESQPSRLVLSMYKFTVLSKFFFDDFGLSSATLWKNISEYNQPWPITGIIQFSMSTTVKYAWS